MKFFAITPDSLGCEDLLQHLPSLKEKGVSFVYVRSSLLYDNCDTIISAADKAGIVPILPYSLSGGMKKVSAGIHFKSFEAELLAAGLSAKAPVITAACHDFDKAVTLLQGRADYVFVSPVFSPLSKQGDTRGLFPRDKLRALIALFGERVVALGGMTKKRITELQDEAGQGFSVAGITMFFEK